MFRSELKDRLVDNWSYIEVRTASGLKSSKGWLLLVLAFREGRCLLTWRKILSIPELGVNKSLVWRKCDPAEGFDSADSLLIRTVPTVEFDARVILSLNFGVFGYGPLSSWIADGRPDAESLR